MKVKQFIRIAKVLPIAILMCLFVTSCGSNVETVSQEAGYDKIELSDNGSKSDAKGVEIDGGVITITKEGNYILSGTLDDGMVIVDTDKTQEVQLVLNGANINSSDSAAIYVRKADKVFITLAKDSENTLSNGGSFTAIDDNNIDAVIFSKDDLTLNGAGSLSISSPAGHGIVSKDELVITGGSYYITASSHGLAGKDIVTVSDGYFAIEAGKDAIHSVNDDDDSMGNVYIKGGTYDLSAGSDGIGVMNEINIEGGSIVIADSYEGIEGRCINISGGNISIHSSDDGLNATDKREDADNKTDGAQGGMMRDGQEEAAINISGGIIKINAEGDGIDSNGYITVTGGETYVAGSSGGKDSAIDYGIDAQVSGGVVVAAGQQNMAQNFGNNSTQGSILVNTDSQNAAGSDIVLLDRDGNTLVAWTMEKSYNSVVVSCEEITDKEAYTVRTGSVETEIVMDGLIYGDGFGSFGGPGGVRGPEEFGGPDNVGGPGGFGGPDGANGPKEFGDMPKPEHTD